MPDTKCELTVASNLQHNIKENDIDQYPSGLHGYTHEAVSALTEVQERAVLERSIEIPDQVHR